MIEIKSFAKPKTNIVTSSGSSGNVYNAGINEDWVEDNYVSKAFFQQLFTVHAASDNSEVVPNTTSTEIGSIESKFGLWTYSFVSALGLSNSGGGGGGTVSYLADLEDVVLNNPTNGQALLYDSSTQLWKNGTVSGGGGGGTGTVTSVAMTVPTGLSISGSPITSSGTLALSFTNGYSIPTTAKQNSWDAAYTTANTLKGYFNASGVAKNALRLSTTSKTAWGQQYWTSGGVPTNISGNMTSVGNITTGTSGGSLNGFYGIEMNTNGTETSNGGYIDFHYNGSSSNYTSRIIEDASGRVFVDADNGLRIGNGIIKWDSTNSCLMIQKYDGTSCDLYATGGISALGLSNGGSGGSSYLYELNDVVISNPTNGQALLYDSNTGKWKNGTVSGGGGGGTGTVTSVAMTVPTGFSITGSPITNSGTLQLKFASGYKLPTTAKQNAWDAGLNDISQIYSYFNVQGAALEAEHAGLADQAATATTATTATKLATTNKTAWGQQYWTNAGTPVSISGNMTSVGNITTASSGGSLNGFHSIEMNTNGSETGHGGFIDFHYNGYRVDYTSRIIEDASGRIYIDATNGLRIGNGIIKWDTTNSCLMIQKYDGTACDIYATGGVSALGLSAGSSSVDTMTFDNVTVNNRLYISNYGSITYSGGAMKLSSPQSIKINSDDVLVDPAGGVHAKKFYLSGTTYLFADGSTLKFWNGSAEKSVIVT